jgi:hypothetical protein
MEKEVSALGISLSCTINDKRALVIQTHVAQDADQRTLNALLERMCDSADKLDLRYRLKDLKTILEKQEEELPMHEDDLEKYESEVVRTHQASGRRGEFKWAGQHDANRRQKAMNIATVRKRIMDTKKAIAEAEAELAE